MLHVFSVHINGFWPPIQRRFLNRYAHNFRIYGALSGGAIEAESCFDETITLKEWEELTPHRDHRMRLICLLAAFSNRISDEDYVCIIDSDSIPISPFQETVERTLEQYSAIGIVRKNVSIPWEAFWCIRGDISKKLFCFNRPFRVQQWERKVDLLKPCFCLSPEIGPGAAGIYGKMIFHFNRGSNFEISPILNQKQDWFREQTGEELFQAEDLVRAQKATDLLRYRHGRILSPKTGY